MARRAAFTAAMSRRRSRMRRGVNVGEIEAARRSAEHWRGQQEGDGGRSRRTRAAAKVFHVVDQDGNKLCYGKVINCIQKAAIRDVLLQAGVHPFNRFTYDHLYGTKGRGTIFNENGFRSTADDLLSSSNHKNLRALLHSKKSYLINNESYHHEL